MDKSNYNLVDRLKVYREKSLTTKDLSDEESEKSDYVLQPRYNNCFILNGASWLYDEICEVFGSIKSEYEDYQDRERISKYAERK